VVKLGLTDDSRTEAGVFHGGETWSFIVEPFDPPATFEWEIHDDGYQGAPLNETGTSTVNEVGNISRLAQYWNLRDVTAGEVLLENMSVVNGFDLYPDRDDIITDLGNEAAPIVDGFQIWVDVGYEAPITFRSAELVEDPGGNTSLTSSSNTEALDIQNYTIFSGVVSSKAIDNFGVGTNELLELQQDYEYRFTGVWDSMQVGDQTVHYVESGGQMATVFRMISGGALATNPLNPNPGVAEPFLVRIPFEVWNVSDPENPYQVNFAFRHRESDGTEEVFYSWPQSARAYGIIINSEYNPEQVIPIDSGPSDLNNPATWVTVHYGTNYDLGAVVKLTYANPIQFGVDTYTFQTQSVSFSQDKAVEDVANINVFPNPYYGVNPQEINKYQRFVTFSHLPEKATIRILNLAGQLVRTIQKDDDSQFQRWDLLNDSGLPVASGLYIVYFDMPDIGATKIVKVAIIQEEQILDRF